MKRHSHNYGSNDTSHCAGTGNLPDSNFPFNIAKGCGVSERTDMSE